MSTFTPEQAAEILADAASLVARLQEDEEARERARQLGLIPEAPLPPLPHRAEPEPVIATRSAYVIATEQHRAAAAYAARMTPKSKPKPAMFTRNQIAALGQAIAMERKRMRKHVADELQSLRDEVAQLRAEIAVRGDVDQLRQQLAVIRSDRDRVLDLTPTRKGNAA